MGRRTRKHDVFEFICRYASENKGVTPPVRTIASGLGLSPSRVQYLMSRLFGDGVIRIVDKTQSYKVVDSEWDPPPYSDF